MNEDVNVAMIELSATRLVILSSTALLALIGYGLLCFALGRRLASN